MFHQTSNACTALTNYKSQLRITTLYVQQQFKKRDIVQKTYDDILASQYNFKSNRGHLLQCHVTGNVSPGLVCTSARADMPRGSYELPSRELTDSLTLSAGFGPTTA